MCILLASILGVILASENKDSNTIYNDVVLNNIEALANSEDIGNLNLCIDTGSTKCPSGEYVKTLFLKIDDNDETSLF